MISQTVSKTDKIRDLNDAFRRTFIGGAVVITPGVEAMAADQRQSILAKVRAFEAFTADNDPHGEHDFGAVEERNVRCFWKIDYHLGDDRPFPRRRRSLGDHPGAHHQARRGILTASAFAA
jgi:hypothetical protein